LLLIERTRAYIRVAPSRAGICATEANKEDNACLPLASSAVALIASIPISTAMAQEQGIHGIWWTKGKKGRVEIVDCAPPAKGVCGKIVWISQPNDAKGRPQTDRANGNPSLRSRPIVGLQLFEGWRENGRRSGGGRSTIRTGAATSTSASRSPATSWS
jgi:hypothetical protein